MAKRWYVVHAYSGYEKHVMRSLLERVKLAGMEDGFGEILVPTEEVVEMRNGQKRKSERKFFPGYVLVQMDMNEGTWHLVKDTPRVMGFIGGTADKPAPITDKEAEAILRRVADGSDKPKPKTLMQQFVHCWPQLVRAPRWPTSTKHLCLHFSLSALAMRRARSWPGRSLMIVDPI